MRRYRAPGHPLDGGPLVLRESGLVEVACEHGVGHPTPESAAALAVLYGDGRSSSWTTHGCDGCCMKACASGPTTSRMGPLDPETFAFFRGVLVAIPVGLVFWLVAALLVLWATGPPG